MFDAYTNMLCSAHRKPARGYLRKGRGVGRILCSAPPLCNVLSEDVPFQAFPLYGVGSSLGRTETALASNNGHNGLLLVVVESFRSLHKVLHFYVYGKWLPWA